MSQGDQKGEGDGDREWARADTGQAHTWAQLQEDTWTYSYTHTHGHRDTRVDPMDTQIHTTHGHRHAETHTYRHEEAHGHTETQMHRDTQTHQTHTLTPKRTQAHTDMGFLALSEDRAGLYLWTQLTVADSPSSLDTLVPAVWTRHV